MESDEGFVPAIILQNKGVPIRLHRLDEAGERMFDGDGDEAAPIFRTLHLRFDARAVSEIEDAFDGLRASVPVTERVAVVDGSGKPLVGPDGPVYDLKVLGTENRTFYGLEAFQKSMEVKPTKTVLRTLQIGLGMDQDTVGKSMVDGLMVDYQNAVGVAWSIAQGVDPSDAAKVLQQARTAVAERRANLASQLAKTMDEASGETTASPGNPG